MSDEFESARQRIEAHPTIADYLRSRTDEQLAALIYDPQYMHNIFASYTGYSGDHARAVIAEAYQRGVMDERAKWQASAQTVVSALAAAIRKRD